MNFDGITYAKGASVLKQLVAYVGRERFFDGIHRYLTRHAFANATLDDLLNELEATSGRDMKAWSALWLEQAGINTIAADVEENADGTIASLTLPRARRPSIRCCARTAWPSASTTRTRPPAASCAPTASNSTWTEPCVTEAAGKPRPAFILVNDDDLTYTKLRFDAASLEFAVENLYRFDNALARAVIWLALWDMTRDAELPAERFIETTLKLLAHETESTTFRYALSCMGTTAHHYVAPARREHMLRTWPPNCGRWRTPPKPVPTTSSSSSTPTWAARRATPNSPRTCAACSTAP